MHMICFDENRNNGEVSTTLLQVAKKNRPGHLQECCAVQVAKPKFQFVHSKQFCESPTVYLLLKRTRLFETNDVVG